MVQLLAALLFAGHPQTASCCGSMAAFANDPAFIAAHPNPLPFDFAPKDGHNVAFKASIGSDARGYYVPPVAGDHAAVILVHEYWGLNDYIRQEAERLHQNTGYAVLAVDLYDGKIATDSTTAAQYMAGVDEERCIAIVDGAIHALKNNTFGFKPTTIGTVGYCFGGGWSERTAVVGGKNIQACVVYYGMPDMRPESLAMLKAPVLMFQGKQDSWINDKVVSQFEAAMRKAHKSLEVRAYDAPHAFANPSNPKYNAAAEADAMTRELAFFKAHL
jgi:carboxymethylenebutenolidase